MKQRPTVTYIKDGKETTVRLNIFNEQKIFKNIFDITYIEYRNLFLYTIREDIELIHLKNYNFKHNFKLESETYLISEEKLIIFEECNFECDSITIETDNIEIINPKFSQKFKLNINNTIAVSLVSNEKNSNLDLRIRNCNQVLLQLNSSLNLLQIYDSSNICLKGLNKLNDLVSSYIFSRKLTLENSHIKELNVYSEEITLKNSIIENNTNDFDGTKLIALFNSCIISDNALKLPKLTKLEFNDQPNNNPSYLEAKTFIQIGKEKYQNLESSNPLRINLQSLENSHTITRQKFLSTLRKIRNEINSNVKSILSEEEQLLFKEVKDYEKEKQDELMIIKKEIDEAIANKKNKATTEIEQTKKHLLSKKITTYIKKETQ